MLNRDVNASHLHVPYVLGCCQLTHMCMRTHNVYTHTICQVPIYLIEPSLSRIALLRSRLDGIVAQVLKYVALTKDPGIVLRCTVWPPKVDNHTIRDQDHLKFHVAGVSQLLPHGGVAILMDGTVKKAKHSAHGSTVFVQHVGVFLEGQVGEDTMYVPLNQM
jgi:hypothetical protein